MRHAAACIIAAIGTLPCVWAGAEAQHARHASHAGNDASESAALMAELEAVRRATERYRDIEHAKADGYVRFGRREGPLMGEHWFRRDLVDQPLDLTSPSTLQYATIGGERVLVGVAYTTYQRPGSAMPEGFAGDGDVWHVHDVARFFDALTDGRPLLRRLGEHRMRRTRAPPASGRTHLVMLHAWVWLDNPDGVFALHHRSLPYLRAGLPASWAEGATSDAALGVALLQDDACAFELRSTAFLARMDRSQRRQLRARCDQAASTIRTARPGADAHELNALAAREWRAYRALRDSLLSPAQQARLASVIEHGDPLATGHH